MRPKAGSSSPFAWMIHQPITPSLHCRPGRFPHEVLDVPLPNPHLLFGIALHLHDGLIKHIVIERPHRTEIRSLHLEAVHKRQFFLLCFFPSSQHKTMFLPRQHDQFRMLIPFLICRSPMNDQPNRYFPFPCPAAGTISPSSSCSFLR